MAELPDNVLFSQAVSHALFNEGKPGMNLKPEQLQAIHHLYKGRDILLWLPTGFWKSLCYEVLLFLFEFKLSQIDLQENKVL